MKLIVQAISDIGNVRTNNEDMILIGRDCFRNDYRNYEFDFDNSEIPLLLSIADGMGGHLGGEYASEIVLQGMSSIIGFIPNDLSIHELRNTLEKSINEIHSLLLQEGKDDPKKKGMGSTFVGVLFYLNLVFMINIGDSRLYRYRDGILSQLSRDHSLSEMTGNPYAPKNIIMNSFGAGEKIFFDFDDITERILPNDFLLLCSDGLNNELSDEEIEETMLSDSDPAFLIKAVKNKEGRDNISVILCYIC